MVVPRDRLYAGWKDVVNQVLLSSTFTNQACFVSDRANRLIFPLQKRGDSIQPCAAYSKWVV